LTGPPSGDGVPPIAKPAGLGAEVIPLRLSLAAIMALSLILRVIGLNWGLPGPGRSYPYHPDEPLLAIAALQIDFAALQLSPRFFSYGSLPIYLDRLAFDVAGRVGWAHSLATPGVKPAELVGDVIRVSRWVTVLMGVLTVWALGVLGARLYGQRTGLLAALLLALTPLHAAQGHYCTVDVPAALWTTFCLLLCAGVMRAPDRATLALAGLCAGLAASTRYNAGVVLAAPLVTLAATWRRPEWYASDRAAAAIYTPLAALGAFLLTTPGILIDSGRFWHDFLFELQHSETGHGLVFVNTPPAWIYHLTRSLPDGLGVPLTLAVIAGVVWAAVRHTKEDGLLLGFVLVFFLVIGGAQLKFARYLMPVLPALLLLAARLLVGGEGEVRGMNDRPDRAHALDSRGGAGVSAAVRLIAWAWIILAAGCYSVAMVKVFARPDPRDQAAGWVQQALRPGERVGLGGPPWFYTPPLVADLGCANVLKRICGGTPPAWIVAPGRDQEALPVETLAQARPKYVVVSEFEYFDPLRLRNELGRTDAMTLLIDTLHRRYRLVRTFRNRPSLGPIRWFTGGPPVHDLLYPMPDIRLYQRVGR
jgi:4-amino-4-deoxy-L-arabinose transferase-like glycosyltransferase